MPLATLDPPAAAATQAPLSLTGAVLRVRDLDLLTRFYAEEMGFALLAHDAAEAVLGAGEVPLLRLLADPAATRPAAGEAGLFHLAWRLPGRVDLARWALRACANGLNYAASDHAVSEALYLNDPEGNGIEVYADRAPDSWRWQDGRVAMVTQKLDIRLLRQVAQGECAGMVPGTVLGHVHLKVGAIAPAEAFWTAALGMAVTAHYGAQAVFMAGLHAPGLRYHHHVAANVWESSGAGPRPAGRTGLEEFNVMGGGLAAGAHVDPWGNRAVVAS